MSNQSLQGATTLFVTLKGPELLKANKLIVAGAFGYFILGANPIIYKID